MHHLGLCIVATNEISLTSTATSTDDESQNNLQPDDPSLDYIMNDDGSCQCKLCGEKVASRTHWYRHKYKVHNVALFRCEKCEIFFKSKKGYEGHIANKHAPKIIGTDGKPKTKKDVEGLNKVSSDKNRILQFIDQYQLITFNLKVIICSQHFQRFHSSLGFDKTKRFLTHESNSNLQNSMAHSWEQKSSTLLM